MINFLYPLHDLKYIRQALSPIFLVVAIEQNSY